MQYDLVYTFLEQSAIFGRKLTQTFDIKIDMQRKRMV